MGYMRHHAIVVTSGGYDDADKALGIARGYAVGLGCAASEIVASSRNGHQSFFVAPDGSKEGWGESDDGDARREKLIAHLKSTRYEDGSAPLSWVEVQYGDDNWETRVTDDSDADRRHREAARA